MRIILEEYDQKKITSEITREKTSEKNLNHKLTLKTVWYWWSVTQAMDER